MHRRAFLTTAVAVAAPVITGCSSGNGSEGSGDGESDGGSGGGTDSSSDGGDSDGSGGYGGGGGGETASTTAESADTTSSTTTAGRESTTTAGSAAQSAYPDYDWGRLDGAEPTDTAGVTLRDTAFHPLVARVAVGTEVTFTNEDSGSHTVTIPALDVDEQLSGGASTTVTFAEAGTYDYVCTFHPPEMLGRIVVE